MAKVQIKSEKLTPFGGIFSIMEQFDALLAQTIDSTLGLVALWGKGILCLRRFLLCPRNMYNKRILVVLQVNSHETL